MGIRIYDTLTKSKQDLVTREPGKISMYVCGPTVYDHVHIGNARSAVAFDVIRRYMRFRGLEVTYVLNHTDVDDKIINRASESNADPVALASEYSRAFEQLMSDLGILPPDILVKATDHIVDMVATITTLIEAGAAYESAGNVWFSVRKKSGYGKLSGRSLDDLSAGERVEPDPSKLDPLDFALWKAAKPGEPTWDSPWGPGRPGWHIECSVMSVKYLGMGFDLHGGGSDLIFPHHENEIAQAESAHGGQFVRYWLHNGMLNMDSEKMSKSLGNYVYAKDVLVDVPASVVRLMSVAAQYRSDLEFNQSSIDQARRAVERFGSFLLASGESHEIDESGQVFIDRFVEAMDDDFNTPLALSVMYDLVKTGNTCIEKGADVGGMRAALEQMLGVFAIDPTPSSDDGLVGDLIELALELRDGARKAGRYDDADAIRDRLVDLGVSLQDGSDGTRWRLKI
ncbi:MAG: cysteine--tRNA ligase [Actinomycetota bacterium]